MAKISFDEKLVVEDFPEQRSWIEPMFRVLNSFMAQVGSALKARLTFLENMLGDEREFDFKFQSAAISFPQKFQWRLSSTPRALYVVSATANTVPFCALAAWEYTPEGLVQLTEIYKATAAAGVVALTAGTRYRIRVRVTP